MAKERLELAARVQELKQDISGLIEHVARRRAQAVNRWATGMATELELARVRAEVSELHSTIVEMNVAIHLERSELHKQIFDLHEQIEDLRQSTSWRVTRPLRFLGGGLVSRTGLRQ